MKTQTPQFHAQFHALGCRLNQAEMHGLESMLEGDVAIVNSCAVTNEAVRQTRQLIRRLKREAPQRPVYVTGCAAQLAPEAFAAMPEVHGIVANKDKLAPQAWGALEAVRLKKDAETAPQSQPQSQLQPRPRAYVKIQNGCDHACTFCIIPQARGVSSSVPAGQVVQEVQAALDAGSREISLTGVDLTSWGGDLPGRPSLSWLLGCLFRHITRDFRLRLTSLDGVELDEAFFALFAGESRLAPHVHLSFQSGNDLILKRMRRRHQREEALALCHRLRACRPEATLGADFIAGFPTETELMFEDTLRFIQEAGLVFLHVFPYAARQGTPAARMPQLPPAVRKARARLLREAGQRNLAAYLQSRVGGLESRVLIEQPAVGRTAAYARVRLEEPSGAAAGGAAPVALVRAPQAPQAPQAHVGQFRDVKIEQACLQDGVLRGSVLPPEPS